MSFDPRSPIPFYHPDVASYHAVSDHDLDQLRGLYQKINTYNSKSRTVCQQNATGTTTTQVNTESNKNVTIVFPPNEA